MTYNTVTHWHVYTYCSAA